jgi:probable rRNA maturation factor
MTPEGRRGRSRTLRVLVAREDRRPVSTHGLATWLSHVAPPRARGAVGVALVDDRMVRSLNRQYRKRDYATDVLSFPAFAPGELRGASARQAFGSDDFLGDVVIARGVARRQARSRGHSEKTEIRILALHGLLHLLGYDHDHVGDRGTMARLERRLRKKGGLREGLIERETGR